LFYIFSRRYCCYGAERAQSGAILAGFERKRQADQLEKLSIGRKGKWAVRLTTGKNKKGRFSEPAKSLLANNHQ